MQLTDSSEPWRWNRVVAFGLVVLLVGSLFAGVAAAQPAMSFRGAELSETTVTVGESVTVTASVVNVGSSGGGYTFEFERNGTDFSEQRVQVDQNEVRTVNASVRFDSPGTYLITVSDNEAGYVTVKPARTQVASENATQRRLDIRAGSAAVTEPTEFEIPPSNRTVALQGWSTTTGESAFQQYLTEFTNRSDVSGPLPERNSSTLLGTIEFESDDEFQQATMRVGVNDSALTNSSLEREAVTLYQRNGTVWDRLPTTVSSTAGDNRTVYEATATRGSTYVVGRIDSDISVSNTVVQTTAAGDGDRVVLDAELRNTGSASGEFVGVMRVNGEEVNRTAAIVPAEGSTFITLSHRLTSPGTYNIRLNQSRTTQVIIRDSPQDDGSTQSTETQPGTQATAGGSNDGQSDASSGTTATIFGVNIVYVAGGVAIALGAFIAILLMLRRSGGGADSDSFDQL